MIKPFLYFLKIYLCIILLSFNTHYLYSKITIEKDTASVTLSNIKYFDKDHFLIEGTVIPDSLKESPYDRLPISYKNYVRKPVWDLSKSSAGLSIRFLSNSSKISAKWEVLNDFKMAHMPDTGIKGIDLYYKSKNGWQFLSTGFPTGNKNESVLIQNMTNEIREYKIFLPLYDGVNNIEIGIDSNSFIKKGDFKSDNFIIFYGTSITQGGCASRPGMAHTNIISRKLDVNVLNFGFSGNGRMEKPIAELISNVKPLFYVIECMPNMINSDNIVKNTRPLVDVIREKNPETPIVLVDLFDYSFSVLDLETKLSTEKMNSALKIEYEKLLNSGYRNIFYINSKNSIGTDQEGTVDGVHFTDLGFMRYSSFLIEKFNSLELIKQ